MRPPTQMNPTPETETPLTDAAWKKYREHYDLHAFEKMVKFARELERDRKRLREALRRLLNVPSAGTRARARFALEMADIIDAKLSKETT